jgi:hypothetical protein
MKRPRTPVDQIEFMRNLLAFLLVGAFISILPLLAFKIIPAVNKDIITYMVGQLSGMATMALGFYFVNKVGQDALDAARTDNTGKALDAIKEAARAGTPTVEAGDAAQDTAEAAQDKADEISGDAP